MLRHSKNVFETDEESKRVIISHSIVVVVTVNSHTK